MHHIFTFMIAIDIYYICVYLEVFDSERLNLPELWIYKMWQVKIVFWLKKVARKMGACVLPDLVDFRFSLWVSHIAVRFFTLWATREAWFWREVL